MKTFLLITLILALFTGCTSSNAFSRFNISQEQAKSENSILSSKIHSDKKTVGIVSAVYLNQVLPETYHGDEWFYVSVYTKGNVKDLQFFLNGRGAFDFKELDQNNKFSHLNSSKEDWKTYYLVQFNRLGSTLSFVTKNSLYSSDALVYKKED